MAGLFYIFSAPFSFSEDEYFFRYQGVIFKLVNGGKEYQHYLATVVSEINHPNKTDSIASEFLACLALDADMPVIYHGTFGSGSYNEELFRMPIRSISTAREIPLHIINHKLPKKIPNLTSKNKKIVLAIYQESLISRSNLPQYAFLSYWKILSILENNDNPSKKILQLIGKEFFEKIGYNTDQEIFLYLKVKLRNRIGHVLGGGKKDIFIMDPEVYFELQQINRALWTPVVREVRKFLSDKPPLQLFNNGTNTEVYMTEADFYKI